MLRYEGIINCERKSSFVVPNVQSITMSKILIAGGTGLIGTRLTELLIEDGHEVVHLSRRPKSDAVVSTYRWDFSTNYIDPQALTGVDVVINLAGAGVADKRWTKSRKQLIISSRVESNRLLKQYYGQDGFEPKVFLSSAAIGFYGDRGNAWLEESSSSGTGFLAESCRAWENAIHELEELPWRVAYFRIGIVLSNKGGAFPQFKLPLQFFVAPFFGNGNQWYSWIHIDDVCGLFIASIQNANIEGVINAVAPNPVTNKQFNQFLAREMKRWVLPIWAPAFAMRIALGEMAAVVLTSSRVSASKAISKGFSFQFPSLEKALADLRSREV